MPGLRHDLTAAARAILAAPGDLSDYAHARPGSEAQAKSPAKDICRNLGWPMRRVLVPHQKAPGQKIVEQEVLVFPTAMLRRLAAAMKWDEGGVIASILE